MRYLWVYCSKCFDEFIICFFFCLFELFMNLLICRPYFQNQTIFPFVQFFRDSHFKLFPLQFQIYFFLEFPDASQGSHFVEQFLLKLINCKHFMALILAENSTVSAYQFLILQTNQLHSLFMFFTEITAFFRYRRYFVLFYWTLTI